MQPTSDSPKTMTAPSVGSGGLLDNMASALFELEQINKIGAARLAFVLEENKRLRAALELCAKMPTYSERFEIVEDALSNTELTDAKSKKDGA